MIKEMIEDLMKNSEILKKARDPETTAKLKTWLEDGKSFVFSQHQVQNIVSPERIEALAKKLSTTQEKVVETLTTALPLVLYTIESLDQKAPPMLKGAIESWLVSPLRSTISFLNGLKKSPGQPSQTNPAPSPEVSGPSDQK